MQTCKLLNRIFTRFRSPSWLFGGPSLKPLRKKMLYVGRDETQHRNTCLIIIWRLTTEEAWKSGSWAWSFIWSWKFSSSKWAICLSSTAACSSLASRSFSATSVDFFCSCCIVAILLSILSLNVLITIMGSTTYRAYVAETDVILSVQNCPPDKALQAEMYPCGTHSNLHVAETLQQANASCKPPAVLVLICQTPYRVIMRQEICSIHNTLLLVSRVYCRLATCYHLTAQWRWTWLLKCRSLNALLPKILAHRQREPKKARTVFMATQ